MNGGFDSYTTPRHNFPEMEDIKSLTEDNYKHSGRTEPRQLRYVITFTGNKENDGIRTRKLKEYKNIYVFKNKNLAHLDKLAKPPVVKKAQIEEEKKVIPQRQIIMKPLEVFTEKPKDSVCDKLQRYLKDLNSLHDKLLELKQKKIMDVKKYKIRGFNNQRAFSVKIKDEVEEVADKKSIRTCIPRIRRVKIKRKVVGDTLEELETGVQEVDCLNHQISRKFQNQAKAAEDKMTRFRTAPNLL